jgi:hypothetical protein
MQTTMVDGIEQTTVSFRCPTKDVDCAIAGEVPNRGWAMRSAPHAKIVAVPPLSSTLDDDVAWSCRLLRRRRTTTIDRSIDEAKKIATV